MHCFGRIKNTDIELVRIRKAILKIYSCILVIGLAYYLWVMLTGLGIPCFYYITTGLLCPGCGISRMFMSLFRLDFLSAFRYNPACFALFFLWNFIAVLCYIGKPRFVRTKVFLCAVLCFTIILLLIFCIIRNFN